MYSLYCVDWFAPFRVWPSTSHLWGNAARSILQVISLLLAMNIPSGFSMEACAFIQRQAILVPMTVIYWRRPLDHQYSGRGRANLCMEEKIGVFAEDLWQGFKASLWFPVTWVRLTLYFLSTSMPEILLGSCSFRSCLSIRKRFLVQLSLCVCLFFVGLAQLWVLLIAAFALVSIVFALELFLADAMSHL